MTPIDVRIRTGQVGKLLGQKWASLSDEDKAVSRAILESLRGLGELTFCCTALHRDGCQG